MASAIDATKPEDGVQAHFADLRTNLLAAKNEITALQAAITALQAAMVAGGPIHAFSTVPDNTGGVFPYILIGATNSRRIQGFGVGSATVLAADATCSLQFQMPPALPTGTGKLRLLVVANAQAGDASFNIAWGSCAVGENFDTVALAAEGATRTMTWATGDNDKFKELKIPLVADTLVANEIVVMTMTFLDATHTLATAGCWIPSIIWE